MFFLQHSRPLFLLYLQAMLSTVCPSLPTAPNVLSMLPTVVHSLLPALSTVVHSLLPALSTVVHSLLPALSTVVHSLFPALSTVVYSLPTNPTAVGSLLVDPACWLLLDLEIIRIVHEDQTLNSISKCFDIRLLVTHQVSVIVSVLPFCQSISTTLKWPSALFWCGSPNFSLQFSRLLLDPSILLRSEML